MYHISCDENPVVGWLINNSLDLNRKIHRASLIALSKGHITVYYHMERFILECDTVGDHNPNEYFFFKSTEKEEIHKMLDQMLKRLGVENPEKTHLLTESTLDFVSTDFSKS